jgi:hypothetical protein
MLPRTLDILERTALVPLHPDWTPAQTDEMADAIRAAAAIAVGRTATEATATAAAGLAAASRT